MSTADQRHRLADMLEKVGKQVMSARTAVTELATWQDYPWEYRELADAYHALVHFGIDEDVRQQNREYSDAAIAGLLKRADDLRR